MDDSYQRNATRIGEDIVAAIERRPSTEARLASALGRIQAGTYTEPGYFQPAQDARDPLGRYRASATCGEAVDDFGRCASRFHSSPDCHTVTEGAAATSTAEAVTAWGDTLQDMPRRPGTDAEALGLASPSPAAPEPWSGDDAWADLLSSGEPGDDSRLRARVLHSMGEADPPAPEPRPDLPPVTVLRAQLGI